MTLDKKNDKSKINVGKLDFYRNFKKYINYNQENDNGIVLMDYFFDSNDKIN